MPGWRQLDRQVLGDGVLTGDRDRGGQRLWQTVFEKLIDAGTGSAPHPAIGEAHESSDAPLASAGPRLLVVPSTAH